VNRGLRRAAAVFLLVLAATAAALAGAGPASAAELLTSDPKTGSVIGGATREVRLTFSQPVTYPEIKVIDAAGRAVDGVPRIESTQIVVPLSPTIAEGPVRMDWRVRAGQERLSGDITFRVAKPLSSAAALALTGATRTQVSGDTDSHADAAPREKALWAALRGAGLVAVMLALGAGLFAAVVHDGGRDRRRLVLVTALGAVAGTGLVAGAALLDGEPLSRRETLSLGLLAAGALLVVAGTLVARPGRAVPKSVVVVGTVIAGMSFAPSGHAASSGVPVVAEIALAVHVVAMGLWLGGLVGVGLTLAHRRHVRTAQREAMILRRYGVLAAASVSAGLLGGLVLAVIALPEVASLWESRWGLVLAGKSAAVGVVLILALLNRGALRAPVGPDDDPARPLLAETPAFTSIDDHDPAHDPGPDHDPVPDHDPASDHDPAPAPVPVPAPVLGVPRDGPSRRGLRLRLGAEAFVLAGAAAVSAALVQADPGAGAREYLRVVPMGNRIAAVMSDDLTAGEPTLKVMVRNDRGRVDTDVTELSLRLSSPDGMAGPRYDLTRPELRETFDVRLPLSDTGRWTMELSYRVSDVDRGDATIVLPVG
jgi:copper transport protein